MVESIDSLLASYYRCHFTEVFDAVRAQHDPSAELVGLAANALLELHQVDAAKAWLARAADGKGAREATRSYLVGRYHYLDRDYRGAIRHFHDSLAGAADGRAQAQARLGLANTHIDLGEAEAGLAHLEALRQAAPGLEPSARLCLHHLEARFAALGPGSPEHAEEHCKNALRIAAAESWTYWIIKSVYFLAKSAKVAGAAAKHRAYAELFEALIADTQCFALRALARQEFADTARAFGESMLLDASAKALVIGDRRVELGNSPRLFDFLAFLGARAEPASKAEITRNLWPGEVYDESVHDGRIFNIVTRVRQLVEKYELQPLYLLSSRLGYRLAVPCEVMN